jgi:hypothetical protein
MFMSYLSLALQAITLIWTIINYARAGRGLGLGRIHMHAREDMNINKVECFSNLSGARKMLRVSRPQFVHAKPCDGPHLVLQHSFRDASRGQAPASMLQARKYLIAARLNRLVAGVTLNHLNM